jgi:hypothetical protein
MARRGTQLIAAPSSAALLRPVIERLRRGPRQPVPLREAVIAALARARQQQSTSKRRIDATSRPPT